MFRQYRNPVVINFLVVDFWNVGSVVEFVDKYNSGLPPPVTEAPTDGPNTNSASSISPAPTLALQQFLLSSSPSSTPTTMAPTFAATAIPATIEPTFEPPTSMAPTATPVTTNPTVAPPVEPGPVLSAVNSSLGVNASFGNALVAGATMDYVPPSSVEMTTVSPNTIEGVDTVGDLGSSESVGVGDGGSNSSVTEVTDAPTLDVWASLQAMQTTGPDTVVGDDGSNGIVADVTIAPTVDSTEELVAAWKEQPDLEHSDSNGHEVFAAEKDKGWR